MQKNKLNNLKKREDKDVKEQIMSNEVDAEWGNLF